MSEALGDSQQSPANTGLKPDTVPEPLASWTGTDPDAMHTFAHPSVRVGDQRSFNGFVDYSVDRFEGVVDVRESTVVTPGVEPYVTVREVRRTTGIGISKWATAAALAGCAVFNVNSIVETGKVIASHLVAPFDTNGSGKTAAPTKQGPSGPTETRRIVSNYEQFNMPSATSAPDPRVVTQAVQAVVPSSGAPGCTETMRVSVVGGTSDEWGGRDSLGHTEPQNEQLSTERATNFVQAMEQEATAQEVDLPTIEVSTDVDVLTQDELNTVDALLAKSGYTSGDGFRRAMRDYNHNPERLPAELRTYFNQHFGQERGVKVTVQKDITCPPADISVPAQNKSGNQLPTDWNLWPLLLAAIPRRKTETVTRSSIGYRSAPLVEHGRRTVSMKLYPEALEADGKTLVPDAWAYTRKYQMLLREDRIKGVLRLNYGKSDESGKQQALKVLFVDKQPQPEFIKHLTKRLEEFSLMQGGKLGSRINAITIFPTENAGHDHHDPSKVGLGIDQQYETGVLGVTTPMLGLVEMHMDTDQPLPEDLDGKFMGADWTLGHEVGGHATDIADNPHTLKPLGEPNEYKYDGDPWQDASYPASYLSIRKHDRFVVPDPAKPGELLVISGNDPRVQVDDPILLNRPTLYSNSSVAEQHAEVAAATQVTDSRIPASQLPPTPGDQSKDFNPANGQYITNPTLRNEYQRHVGSIAGRDGLEWNKGKLNAAKPHWRAHYAPAEWDPEIRRLTAKARSTRLPKNQDLLSIIGEEAI